MFVCFLCFSQKALLLLGTALNGATFSELSAKKAIGSETNSAKEIFSKERLINKHEKMSVLLNYLRLFEFSNFGTSIEFEEN